MNCADCHNPRTLHWRNYLWCLVKYCPCQRFVWPDKIGTLDRPEAELTSEPLC